MINELLELSASGLTDVVKRPTHSSGDLKQDEFDTGAKILSQKLEMYKPEVACFVGLLGATAFLGRQVKPGPQEEHLGRHESLLRCHRPAAGMRIMDGTRDSELSLNNWRGISTASKTVGRHAGVAAVARASACQRCGDRQFV